MVNSNILDLKELFPEHTIIPKEYLIRMTFDPSLAGASSITSLRGSANLCQSALNSITSSDQKASCQKVIAVRKNLAHHQAHLQELIRKKAPKEEIEAAKIIYNHLLEDLRHYSERFCANCPYAKKSASMTHRLNYSRYGSKKETLAHTKVFFALSMIANSSVREGEDLIAPSYISIRKLSEICCLHRNTVRNALKYWESQGIVCFGSFAKGKYQVALTKSFLEKRGLRASEGGAGFITLPFDAIRLIMLISNIDILRLFILVLLEVDNALLNRSFRKAGVNIGVNGLLIKYLKRHQHASMKGLISRFNNEVNLLLKGGSTIILHPKASDETYYSDERFSYIDISISPALCPRQKEMPKEFEILTRRLTPESVEQIEKARQVMFGDSPDLRELLLPKRDGSGSINYDKLGPNNTRKYLIPALETIQNRFGAYFIKDALIQTFLHLKDKITILVNEKKPGTDIFNSTVQEVSAYMQATAANLKNQLLLSRSLLPVHSS